PRRGIGRQRRDAGEPRKLGRKRPAPRNPDERPLDAKELLVLHLEREALLAERRDLTARRAQSLGLRGVRLGCEAGIPERALRFSEGADQRVEASRARPRLEQALFLLGELPEHPPDADPARTGFEEQLSELPLTRQHVLGPELELLVPKAEQPRKSGFVDASEQLGEHGLGELGVVAIAERALAPAPPTREHAPALVGLDLGLHGELGRRVSMCVLRAFGNAEQEPANGAQCRALASLVAAEHEVDTGSELEREVRKRPERGEPQRPKPHSDSSSDERARRERSSRSTSSRSSGMAAASSRTASGPSSNSPGSLARSSPSSAASASSASG